MTKPKIPTLVGLLLILIGAISGVIFISRKTDFLPRARPEYIPQKVKLTNITDTGYTISWITQQATIGFIKMGQSASNLDTTVTDDRDQLTGESGEFKTHYITVQNLTPKTTYSFKLGSHGQQLYDNNGNAFSITTGSTISPPPPVNTVFGNVYTPAHTPAEGALLYLTPPGSTPLSALVKQNGNWAINLADARSGDLSRSVPIGPQTNLDILVLDADGNTTPVSTTLGSSPNLPDIIIGQGLSNASTTVSPTPSGPLPESKFSFAPIVATEPQTDTTITVTSPSKDGTKVSTTPPQFTGSAPPNTKLTVTLHSAPIYTESVTSDTQGNWDWTPPGNLSPGEHTLTIAYNDANGILHTISRTFVVQAAGQAGPSYTSTPSASIAPSPTTPPSPTSPVVTKSPTLVPTTIPTSIPTLVPTVPASASTMPVSGSTSPTTTLLFFGFLALISGFILIKNVAW